ncbi:MAG: adenylate/guanylate cyclase domain-containing protein [Geminicoccaceae bacterium]|nr:adenylate/guanylate cyclase domain-containing protein [Geminicoccaceae bacterium]MCB9966910.1 adenylate/guanylate cyclase domain-containing protein [Geminicoccaceae bacterium]
MKRRSRGMSDTPRLDAADIGRPFPLLRVFLLILLPLLLVSSVGLVIMLQGAISTSAEKLFADQEIRLVRSMLVADGQFDGRSPASASIVADLRTEMAEAGIACLSLVTPDGEPVAEIAGEASCATPDAAAFREVTEDGGGAVLAENIVLPDHWTSLGTVTLPESDEGRAGNDLVVAVTRRSVSLEAAIARLSGFWTIVFGGLFLLAVLATGFVIARAQGTIDRQAAYVLGVHRRLGRFLSVAAVRTAIDDDAAPTRFSALVMFLDLRDFSSFAEAAPPREVAALVDAFVTAVAGAVADQGGEIDKIVGDGILAFFRGDDATGRALVAAIASIEACQSLARRPGIGLYRGEVIATALGTGQRADFTILGRTVNLASRLCSLAAENEITMPEDLAAEAGPKLVETSRRLVQPRHHSQELLVVSFRLA